MDWAEFGMARQLLAEEALGRFVREAASLEDAEFSAAKSAMSKRG